MPPQVKAYTTRVGEGPYPTEIHGSLAEELREVGAEYGTTTGRPRRIGWLDIPALQYVTRRDQEEHLCRGDGDCRSCGTDTSADIRLWLWRHPEPALVLDMVFTTGLYTLLCGDRSALHAAATKKMLCSTSLALLSQLNTRTG